MINKLKIISQIIVYVILIISCSATNGSELKKIIKDNIIKNIYKYMEII